MVDLQKKKLELEIEDLQEKIKSREQTRKFYDGMQAKVDLLIDSIKRKGMRGIEDPDQVEPLSLAILLEKDPIVGEAMSIILARAKNYEGVRFNLASVPDGSIHRDAWKRIADYFAKDEDVSQRSFIAHSSGRFEKVPEHFEAFVNGSDSKLAIAFAIVAHFLDEDWSKVPEIFIWNTPSTLGDPGSLTDIALSYIKNYFSKELPSEPKHPGYPLGVGPMVQGIPEVYPPVDDDKKEG